MQALARIPEARVVACMDVDIDRAAEAAARFAGAGAYADLDEMLDNHELDAVYVCVPPYAHGPIERAVIERGIHLFVEKPLAVDRHTPESVLEALEGKDLITSVGYVLRYRENARRAREFLEGREPVAARGTYVGGVPGAPWWRRKERSGGQIIEQVPGQVEPVSYTHLTLPTN